VRDVAAQFPQLCDAETAALGRLLDVHVQRLATIAHGDGVCTLHIPPASQHSLQREGGSMTTTQDQTIASLGSYKFGWADSDVAGATAQRGINPDVVRNISALKSEPEWMLKMRLRG
jgi:hypothetical protein